MIIREIVVEPQAIAWLPWAVSYFFLLVSPFLVYLLAYSFIKWRKMSA